MVLNTSVLIDVVHTSSGQLNELELGQFAYHFSADLHFIGDNDVSVFAALYDNSSIFWGIIISEVVADAVWGWQVDAIRKSAFI